MKRLIVNADDFGLTPGTNQGILQAHQAGILTSTSILANGDAFEEAIELALANPGLGVGCHLSLIGGRPVAPPDKIPTLVDNEGLMPKTLSHLVTKLMRGVLQEADIVREFRAQIERVFSAGITPTHLDSHKHAHTLPRVMDALVRVAKEYGIRCVRNPFETHYHRNVAGPTARAHQRTYLKQRALSLAIKPQSFRLRHLARAHNLRMPDHFFGATLTGLLDAEAIRSLMLRLRDGTTEMMCHPGIYDNQLASTETRLKRERERELAALTDPTLRCLAEELGISFISYRELA